MSSLRSQLIRLASKEPSLRPRILPLFRTAARELDPEKVLAGEIPDEVMSDLMDGLSNGIGFAAADYTAGMEDKELRRKVSDALWTSAITEFAGKHGVSCTKSASLRARTIRLASSDPELRPHLLPLLAKTAGNLGEELNPYMLDADRPTWDWASEDLQGKVEDTTQAVSALVMAASRELNRVSKFVTEDTKELYYGDLKARLISAIERILPD